MIVKKIKNIALEDVRNMLKEKKNIKKFGWKRYDTSKKGNFCERCNLIPEHNCQLEVDHIDGNRLNNCKENLQTLCANCHRLKTFLNEDYRKNTNLFILCYLFFSFRLNLKLLN